MAKLRPRGKNRWEVVVELPRVGGRRRQLSRVFYGTKRAAGDFGYELEVEVQRGKHSATSRTLGDLLEEWYRLAAPSWSPSTARQDRGIIDNHLADLAGLELRRLSLHTIDAFYANLAQKGLRPATVARIHGTLHRALEQGRKWRWITENPASDAIRPALEDAERAVPSPETVLALLDLADRTDPPMGVFLRLAVVTGARLGELCALHWSDWDGAGALLIDSSIVDPKGGVVEKDTKTRKKGRRIVGLTPASTEALRQHRLRCAEWALSTGTTLAPTDWVFEAPRRPGRPWRPDSTNKRFARLRDQLDVPHFVFHALRHWTGTTLSDAGVNMANVSRWLGHSKQSTTSDIYTHAVDARDALAVEVLTRLVG